MKKLVCLIAVLALTAPLYAAQSQLTLSASDAGSGQLRIGYASNDANAPTGISFKVALSNNATVNASTDVVSSLSSVFNTNIDYANSAGSGYTALGQGHPLANPDANGVVTFPAGTFAVCMGALLQSPAVPPTSTSNLITLQLHAGAGQSSTQATLSADTAGRGGVQGAGAFSVIYPSPVTVTFAAPPCFSTADAKYAQWVLQGKPFSWCCLHQRDGDVNGDGKVTSTDLLMLKQKFGSIYGQAGPPAYDCRADLNHDGKVTSTDLLMLKQKFGQDWTAQGGACQTDWKSNCGPNP